MSMDNCETPYELVQRIVDRSNLELTIDIDASSAASILDVTSAPCGGYWTKDLNVADACANIPASTAEKGNTMNYITSNAASIGWILNDDPSKLMQKHVLNVAEDYTEYSKVPRTTNCHGTFKFERSFDEKEKERKEKMNEAEKENARKIAIKFEPKQILQNGPVTIVFWKDGTKTIVRKSENSADDPYSAFCAALAKKIYGNNSRVKKILDKKIVKAKAKEKKGEKKDGGNAENPEG